jgi:hypothetical protein
VLSRYLSIPSPTGKRARFFASLAAIGIAPVTHGVQAGARCSVRPALAAFAAPEERRYRAVSNRFCTEPWLADFSDANPLLARGAGDADSMKWW